MFADLNFYVITFFQQGMEPKKNLSQESICNFWNQFTEAQLMLRYYYAIQFGARDIQQHKKKQ